MTQTQQDIIAMRKAVWIKPDGFGVERAVVSSAAT